MSESTPTSRQPDKAQGTATPVIIAGSATPLPYAAIAERAARPPFPYRVLHGARVRQLLADSVPFSDEDAEESPEPGRGQMHFG